MSGITLYKDWDPRSIKFGPAAQNRGNGGKSAAFMGPDGKSRLRHNVQTPPLVMPFGLHEFKETEDSEIKHYTIDVSFRDLEADPKAAAFLAKMKQLDDHVMEAAVANAKEWFGKPWKREQLETLHSSLIRDDREDYPPVMKIKVPIYDGEVSTAIFDENRRKVGVDYLVKGTVLKCVIEFGSVYFGAKFGVTAKAVQVLVVSRPATMSEFCMLPDDDDPVPAPAAPAAGGAAAGTAADASAAADDTSAADAAVMGLDATDDAEAIGLKLAGALDAGSSGTRKRKSPPAALAGTAAADLE